MNVDIGKMLEVVDNYERRCDVCKYQCGGREGGLTGGPNGPIYPPCCNLEPQSYVDENLLHEVYNEIMEDLE